MLEKLYLEIEKETGRDDLVFGEGNKNADIVLIGEAPGKEEAAQKKPFVGKAGKNLSEFLDLIGLKREDIFITNAVKFRPTKVSEKGTVSNRTPSWKEVMYYNKWLKEEIRIIAPKVVVTLGNTPLRSVYANNKIVIGDVHGKLAKEQEYGVFPLYHPASIIYNRSLADTYKEDILKLAQVVKDIQK